MFGDGFDHEVGSVADVSGGAEEDGTERDGDKDRNMRSGKGCDIAGLAQIQPFLSERRSEEGQVSRCIIQHRGEHTGESVELQRRLHAERIGVKLHVVQGGNHRPEDTEKEPSHFFDRMEIEVVHLVDLLRRGIPGTERGRAHGKFAPRCWQENGTEDDADENEVAFAVDPELLVSGFEFAHHLGRATEIDRVNDVKRGEQGADDNQPRQPEVRSRPEERNTLEVSEEERRIADRGQRTAGIAHDENEEDHVERGDAVFVHADPRADHEHGRAGRADEI